MSVYLDMAATTPVSPRVAEVVLRYMTTEFGNAGSRSHDWGTRAKKAVASSREQISAMLSARPEELIFTSGATESNNLAILGLAQHGKQTGRRHILSAATEHKAVLEPLEHLAGTGFEVELLQPDETGLFTTEQVLEHVRPDTLLVSLMMVNNETGVIQPVHEVAERLVQTATLLHVDAAQGFVKLPDPLTSPIDLVSISGHKIGAPKGIGALLVRRRGWKKPPLTPLMYGGGQERGLRPGTLPVALIVGLAEAACELATRHDQWWRDSQAFRADLLEALQALGAMVNGDLDRGAPHILNVSIPGADSEALLVALKDVVGVSTGSACTSASYTPSHVLTAMGLSDDRVTGALRFSWWGRPELPLADLSRAVASVSASAA
jgi:cysteine desulfurase